MTRVESLGGVVFEYPLFIKDDFSLRSVRGSAFDTLGGSKVVFEGVKRASAVYVTLISKESGWVREDTLNKIVALLDDVDVEVELVTTTGASFKVRPAVELGEVVKASDAVHEDGGWLKVEILLCKV